MLASLLPVIRQLLAEEKKAWRKTLPRPCKLLPLLLGEAQWPVYQPLFVLCFLVVLFYVKLISLSRVVTECGGGPTDPALRLPPSALRSLRRAWAVLSLLGGLALFLVEAYTATSGGTKLMSIIRAPGAAAEKPRNLWLTLAWGSTFASLGVDALLTLLALAPFFLRLAGALVPPLAACAYPPPSETPAVAAAGADAAPPAPLKAPALGTLAEAMRRLDCSDLVVGRLLELSLLFCFHKYQN